MESFNLNVNKSLLPSFISNRNFEKTDLTLKNGENSFGSLKFDDLLKSNIENERIHSPEKKQDNKLKDSSDNSFGAKNPQNTSEGNDSKKSELSENADRNHVADKKPDTIESKKENKNKSIKDEDKQNVTAEENISRLLSDILKLLQNSEKSGKNTDKKITKEISVKPLKLDDIKDVINSQKDGKHDLRKILELLENKSDMKFSAELKKELKSIVEKLLIQIDNKKQTKTSIAFHNSRKIEGLEAEAKNHNLKNPADSKNTALEIKADSESLVKMVSNSSESTENSKSDLTDFSRQDSILKNISIKGKDASFSSNKPGNLLFKEQLNEIINKSKLVVKNNGDSRILMKLFPEKLGNMNVNIAMDSGQLNAKFLVETADAKNLLMNDLEMLKEALAEQGVNVGSFEVNVKSGQKQMNDFGKSNKDMIMTNPVNNLKNDQINDLVENIETDFRSEHLNLVW